MSGAALDRLRGQLLAGWSEFARTEELDALLAPALEQAAAAPPQILTVTSTINIHAPMHKVWQAVKEPGQKLNTVCIHW